jgi:glyoxylase-like metal-dependent hydrolase (beta-lactamase superfamily II)
MILRPFLYDETACASYLFGCLTKRKLAVVDPHVELVERYLAAAEHAGAPIVAVFETHVQADHVSGLPALVEATGATAYLPAGTGVSFPHTELGDGEVVELGNTIVTALATPGHAPAHHSYVVADRRRGTVGAARGADPQDVRAAAALALPLRGVAGFARDPVCFRARPSEATGRQVLGNDRTDEDPWLVFTGDSLLVGDVGRPDLHADGDARPLARALHRSLRRLLELPDHVAVYPSHYAGSVCGRSLSGNPFSTIGFERRHNAMLQIEEPEAFVDALLDGVPPAPERQAEIVAANRGE